MVEKVNFDDYIENYNELLREGTRFFASDEEYFASYKVDLVRAAVRQPVSRILEYGCGLGRNIRYLRQAFPGAEIVGSDVAVNSLDIARQNNPDVQFEVEPLDPTAAPDLGTFDLIFIAGVFHHIQPDLRAQVARVLRQRLRPGGHLTVFEHNPYNPVTRRIVSNCVYDADAVLLKPSDMRHLLQGAQFTVESQDYCLFVPPGLKALTKLERYLGWLPLGGQYWTCAT